MDQTYIKSRMALLNTTPSPVVVRWSFEGDLTAAMEGGSSESDIDEGDVAAALAGATATVEATYRVPYLAHACMEPMNATARVDGGRCEVWVGTQNPLGFRHEVAAALDMDVEQVEIHQPDLGGGFGRRSNSDSAVQAAKIARAAAVPIKLIWSREEDVQHDHYRPAVASRFRVAVDGGGNITAWENAYHEKHEPVEAPVIPYAIPARTSTAPQSMCWRLHRARMQAQYR